jgi:hypothetical protein
MAKARKLLSNPTRWRVVGNPDQSPSVYPVVSAKPDILGVVEPSTATPSGDPKGPDKHESPSSFHERAGECQVFFLFFLFFFL